MSTEKVCSFEGCEKPKYSWGLCAGHKSQKARGQELRPLRQRKAKVKRPCEFTECGRVQYVKGLCKGHNHQRWKGYPLTPLKVVQSRFDSPDNCTVEGCGSPHMARGLCDKHYQVVKKYNITYSKFLEMVEESEGKCSICRDTDPKGNGTWHVDHDHSCCPGNRSCGKCVRNILCSYCNTGLGLFRDNVAHLLSAIDYLERHGKVSPDTSP